ncbi:precorrin-6y C5,15-methyltransferase (decarboxylating) subunit CbiE [Clostridium sp. MSJ-4]|uniref:Precorrin-6y C5,15-methyltransferase (Decarboxylating) subunit CbiE n=1 Tax=Clostridium simiarum TaxID=2841506 RepID=A0ABS6EWV4_9CLOT|nr:MULTISPECIES: precorrin-6y C5,15-methyltransferase (decarboxylating) subunit CbiE [Clostridium]MBU5590561.1 precorrin-6y C5,15-methyltransferase (decarboxylating) subunit CbiE [Clostridium simiarum]
MLYIVGIGPGHKDYILPKAVEILSNSDFIVGFNRALKSIDFVSVKKIPIKSIEEVLSIAKENEDMKISVIASGDPCFYGISDFINRNYKGNVEVIPGISSFQYLSSKINKSWSFAYLGSVHGREEDFLNKVKENRISFWLTDRNNSPGYLCEKLLENKIKAKIYIGENLSYEDETITIDLNYNLIHKDFSSLSVVAIEVLEMED